MKSNSKFFKIICVLATIAIISATCLCGCDFSSGENVTLSVVQSHVVLNVGESINLVLQSSSSEEVEWHSSDESVATVVNGVITGVNEGGAEIYIICGNLSAVCNVVVVKPEEPVFNPDSIIISLVPVTVEVGESVLVTASSPSGGNLTWISQDSKIASVSRGIITGVAVGETTVTVTVGNNSASFSVKVVASTQAVKKDGYKLLWNDEFEGNSLDNSKWGYQIGVQDNYGESWGPMYWGNGELQYYTDRAENVGVKDGNLYITAKRQAMGDRPYTSARILTRNKFSYTYGYFEARMKLPEGNGMWPAFWMLPEPSTSYNSNNEYGGWPYSGEIDIMEARGRILNEIGTALHYSKDYNHRYTNATARLGAFPITDWHVYAVEKTANYMIWYVDDKQVMRVDASEWKDQQIGSTQQAPFDKPFYMLINLAVGGNYDGGREPDADFTSASLYVDYVRVWAPLK